MVSNESVKLKRSDLMTSLTPDLKEPINKIRLRCIGTALIP